MYRSRAGADCDSICQRHTWQEWHDKFWEIAAEHAGEDIIPEYVQYFNLACKLYSHEDCLIEEV